MLKLCCFFLFLPGLSQIVFDGLAFRFPPAPPQKRKRPSLSGFFRFLVRIGENRSRSSRRRGSLARIQNCPPFFFLPSTILSMVTTAAFLFFGKMCA